MGLLFVVLMHASACEVAAQASAPFDPMRRPARSTLGGVGLDPMRQPMAAPGVALTLSVNGPTIHDPMAYYAQRGALDPNNPMAGLIVGASAPANAPPIDPAAPFGGMPPGAGRELTFALCSACHSIKLVTQQHLAPKRWDYLWGWMIKEQRMPAAPDEVRDVILGYLKQHYSAQ